MRRAAVLPTTLHLALCVLLVSCSDLLPGVRSFASTTAGSGRRRSGEFEEGGDGEISPGSSASSSSLPLPSRTATGGLVIRTTRRDDIPAVAKLLSKAAVVGSADTKAKRGGGGGWGLNLNWKAAVDQLWAKSDLESLLSGRLEAMQCGREASQQVEQILADVPLGDYSEADRMRLLWSRSDKLRRLVEKSSEATGENNVWRHHNMAIPPTDVSWFQHLQMSVVVPESSQVREKGQQEGDVDAVVGFCEVAMLSNPTISIRAEDGTIGEVPFFTPAITNLAISPDWRRRGIATRLLKTAERYVHRHWKSVASTSSSSTEENALLPPLSMGLYVEKANHAALELYRSMGYETTVTCEGGDLLGEMWYMTRRLDSTSSSGDIKNNNQELDKIDLKR